MSGTRQAAAVGTGIALVLLALTPMTTLWDRDEPRFAQAAVEMLSSGRYLVPTFNGEIRPQKPVFVYWLMTGSLRLFGPTEFAVRFWSPIAIALAAFATFIIGRRLWSERAGLSGMIILASSPLTFIEGVAATTDAVLLAAITGCLALFAEALYVKPSWWRAVAGGMLIGVALLTKGPVGLIVPAAIAGCACWMARREIPWCRQIVIGAGVAAAIGIAIFASWLLLAMRVTDGRMATEGLVKENVWRALVAMEGHGTPMLLAPLYYPAVIAVGFLPWTLRLPAAMRSAVGARAWRSRAGALIIAWIAVPVVVFTVAATKLPHYVLPAWPALALLVASQRPTPLVADARRGVLGAAVVALLGFGVAPLVERLKPVPVIADAIRRSPIGGPLVAYEFGEPSLVFYTGRRVVAIEGEDALVAWARQPEDALLVAPRAAIAAIEARRGSLGLREIAAKRGWNYVKGVRLELVAFARPGDR